MASFVLNATKTRIDGGQFSNLRRIVVGVLTVAGADGASALDLPASLFGMNIIDEVSPLVKSDNSLIVTAAPAYDGLSLLGKAAGSAAPADIPAGDYAVVLRGS